MQKRNQGICQEQGADRVGPNSLEEAGTTIFGIGRNNAGVVDKNVNDSKVSGKCFDSCRDRNIVRDVEIKDAESSTWLSRLKIFECLFSLCSVSAPENNVILRGIDNKGVAGIEANARIGSCSQVRMK